jgi:hypothetical protein
MCSSVSTAARGSVALDVDVRCVRCAWWRGEDTTHDERVQLVPAACHVPPTAERTRALPLVGRAIWASRVTDPGLW